MTTVLPAEDAILPGAAEILSSIWNLKERKKIIITNNTKQKKGEIRRPPQKDNASGPHLPRYSFVKHLF